MVRPSVQPRGALPSDGGVGLAAASDAPRAGPPCRPSRVLVLAGRARRGPEDPGCHDRSDRPAARDRKSTRLNSSHLVISYAVFCLKKKKNKEKADCHPQKEARHHV